MIRAILLWLALALPLAAQDLPDWQHTSINDFAGLLTNEDTQVLDQALIALHAETGVEGTVVTLQDRARYGGSDGLEAFATRLFNHWGVGDRTRNDGFMVLVLKDDREARIELGAGYPAAADSIARAIMDRTVLPQFRQGDLSRGLREGTLDVIQEIARPHAAGQPLKVEGGSSWLARLMPVAVLGFIGFVALQMARGLFRRRQPCPTCGGGGLVEDSTVETETLPDGSQATRRVSYRRCPTCGWTSPPRHDSNAGWRRGMSSGRGGFGGGRSSGGGASGRW